MNLTGKHTEAIIYTNNIEEEAIEQLNNVCNHPMFQDEKVRIMPDVHAGMGCVIGFTSTYKDKIIPNLIGVDIGCGMTCANVGDIEIILPKLDDFIKGNIPHGFRNNDEIDIDTELPFFTGVIKDICQKIGDLENYERHLKAVGSLGSGNHFIEVNIDKEGSKYIVIHSGSRNFGHKIATYYQQQAERYSRYPIKELSFLDGELAQEYLKDMKFAQVFASVNRDMILKKIFKFLNIGYEQKFDTIHNYIDGDNIIRKGAVSAKKEELLLIPINMRDGSILAKGKGNSDWNYSAPHGAGRLMSRAKARKTLDIQAFSETMKDVYTTSVNKNTLDEAPFAYKPMDEIINNIGDTVVIIDILKPLYNFKSN